MSESPLTMFRFGFFITPEISGEWGCWGSPTQTGSAEAINRGTHDNSNISRLKIHVQQ